MTQYTAAWRAGQTLTAPFTVSNTSVNVPAPPGVDIPSGPQITYSQLYRIGDKKLSDTFAHLTQPTNVIMDRPGDFRDNDFVRQNNQCHYLGTNVISISGPEGTRGGSNGVTIGVAAGSMSNASKSKIPAQSTKSTNPFSVLTMNGPFRALRNIAFDGTDQGANYHLFSVFNPTDPNGVPTRGGFVYNCGFVGSRGDNGANPGETFQFTLHGCDDWFIDVIECDGRMAADPTHSYAAVGFTVQNSQGVQVWNAYVHDTIFSYAVGYQTDSLSLYNPILGASGRADAAPYNSSLKATHVFNAELNSNVKLYNPILNKSEKNTFVHISHSNFNPTSYKFRNGNVVDMTNGSMSVYNPTYKDIWGDNKLYIQRLYANNTVTPPLVTTKDMVTHLPYKFVDGSGTHIDVN